MTSFEAIRTKLSPGWTSAKPVSLPIQAARVAYLFSPFNDRWDCHVVQAGSGKSAGPGIYPGRAELLELLRHAGITLVLVFSFSSLYALACLPPPGVKNEAIRQPVDITASTSPADPAPVSAVDSGLSSSRSVSGLPGIARPPRSDRPTVPRRVLLGIETRAEYIAEILPDRYPGGFK
jgi:hypothetical protein